jgi:hypothetical protein
MGGCGTNLLIDSTTKSIVSLWRGQRLLESTNVIPHFRNENVNQDYFLGNHKDATSDIACKKELPAWSRTFDVFPAENEDMVPDIVTIQEGGYGIYGENRFFKSPTPPLSCVRYFDSTGVPGRLLPYENRSILWIFAPFYVTRNICIRTQRPVNDFCLVEFDKLIMALNCDSSDGPDELDNTPTMGGLHDGRPYPIEHTGFPVSDMLCVEPIKGKQVALAISTDKSRCLIRVISRSFRRAWMRI